MERSALQLPLHRQNEVEPLLYYSKQENYFDAVTYYYRYLFDVKRKLAVAQRDVIHALQRRIYDLQPRGYRYEVESTTQVPKNM